MSEKPTLLFGPKMSTEIPCVVVGRYVDTGWLFPLLWPAVV